MNVKLQKWDAVVAIYILTAFIMLIVPLPAWILDVFMAFNMAVAFTILFAAMFPRKYWICPISRPSCCSQPFSVSP